MPYCSTCLTGSAPLSRRCAQGFSFQVLHDQKIHVALLTYVVESTNMGMGKTGQRARLPLQALAQLRMTGELGWQDLDCYGALQPSIAGAIHLSHTPRTDLGQD